MLLFLLLLTTLIHANSSGGRGKIKIKYIYEASGSTKEGQFSYLVEIQHRLNKTRQNET